MARPASALVSVVAVAAFSLLAAGCGNSPGVAHVGSRAPASPGSSPATSRTETLALVGRCLRGHGIPNLPDPTIGTSGPMLDKQALLAVPRSVRNGAMTSCRGDLAQAGFLVGTTPHATPQQTEKLLALAHCIRRHGLPSFPDPNPTTGDFGHPPGVSFPQLLAAARACRPLVRAAGLGMPTPSTGTSASGGGR